MSSITIAAKVMENGTVDVPQEAIGALGLRPGDDVRISIESVSDSAGDDTSIQGELRRRLTVRLEEAHRLAREPSKPLTDPLEAEWAKGVEEKARRMGLQI